jgi:hypothetical protein
MDKFWKGLLCCVGCAIWVPAVIAAPLPPTGTFIYSDACISQGGDREGFRVTLTRSPGAMRAVVDFNDSGPDGRDTARSLKFYPASGKLSFSFRGDLAYSFQGIVSSERLQGSLDAVDNSTRPPAPIEHLNLNLPARKLGPKDLADCDPSHPA